MSKRPAQKHFVRVLALSLVIMLAGGGMALLYQWHQGSTAGYASSDSVVGQPSLPASNVDAIFRRLGSPMVGTGKAVEAASRARNIDDAFALAVWWTETNDGAAGVGIHDNNPGSVRGSTGYPSAYDGYTIYPSFTAAVNYWFMMMKNVYINRGLTTVSSISHPYVGTSTSNLWAGKVIALMQKYRAEAPPKPTPTPTIAPNFLRKEKELAKEDQQQTQGTGAPVATPIVQHQSIQQASPAHTPALSEESRLILVFVVLLLAFGLGLWAWLISKRIFSRAQPAAQPVSDVWEQLRTSQQQSAAFLNHTFGVPLRTTESLTERMPATGTLGSAVSMRSDYALPDAFGVGRAQFQNTWTPHPEPVFSGQWSSFNAPAKGDAWGTRPAGFGLPGLPTRASSPPSNPFHRNRLLSDAGIQPSIPVTNNTSQQPQLVGVGADNRRSNGLLSRYREMQELNASATHVEYGGYDR